MIRFELATYSIRPLDPMDFKAKEAFNSSSDHSNRIIKMPKKIKKSKFVRPNFSHIFDSFRFISVRCDCIGLDLIRFGFDLNPFEKNLIKDNFMQNQNFSNIRYPFFLNFIKNLTENVRLYDLICKNLSII
jgi:hypothetical protein